MYIYYIMSELEHWKVSNTSHFFKPQWSMAHKFKTLTDTLAEIAEDKHKGTRTKEYYINYDGGNWGLKIHSDDLPKVNNDFLKDLMVQKLWPKKSCPLPEKVYTPYTYGDSPTKGDMTINTASDLETKIYEQIKKKQTSSGDSGNVVLVWLFGLLKLVNLETLDCMKKNLEIKKLGEADKGFMVALMNAEKIVEKMLEDAEEEEEEDEARAEEGERNTRRRKKEEKAAKAAKKLSTSFVDVDATVVGGRKRRKSRRRRKRRKSHRRRKSIKSRKSRRRRKSIKRRKGRRRRKSIKSRKSSRRRKSRKSRRRRSR